MFSLRDKKKLSQLSSKTHFIHFSDFVLNRLVVACADYMYFIALQ